MQHETTSETTTQKRRVPGGTVYTRHRHWLGRWGSTYMAMTIGDVVGQFELVEGDAWFRHPRLARGR